MKIERYCSSLARSASSARLRALMSRPDADTRAAAVLHRHAAHLELEARAVLVNALGLEVHRLAGERAAVKLRDHVVQLGRVGDEAVLAEHFSRE